MLQIITGAISLGLLWAIMTIGVYITYRILNIADLTVEGSITMGAAIAAKALTGGVNPYLAIILAFFGGMLAGLFTGILHTKLKIPALLSGILTMIALYSVNLRIMGTSNLSLIRAETVYMPFQAMGLNQNNAAIFVDLIYVSILVPLLYSFFETEIGSVIRATGNNPHMVRAQGVNTDLTIVIGLVLSNGLVAVSGGLIAQSQRFADIQMGTGSIVIGLASVIIGEVLFSRNGFLSKLISLVLGAVIYRVIIAFVLKLGMPANDLKLFTAITVAIALALPIFKEYLQTLKKSSMGVD